MIKYLLSFAQVAVVPVVAAAGTSLSDDTSIPLSWGVGIFAACSAVVIWLVKHFISKVEMSMEKLEKKIEEVAWSVQSMSLAISDERGERKALAAHVEALRQLGGLGS